MTLPLGSLRREVRAKCAGWYHFSGIGIAFANWGMIRASLVLYGIMKTDWQPFAGLAQMAK